jgi:hypothetical protein
MLIVWSDEEERNPQVWKVFFLNPPYINVIFDKVSLNNNLRFTISRVIGSGQL